MFRASQQHIVFCLRISSILLSYCDACVLIRCVCVLLRFVVNAEAEKIRIFAAAHLQRSRWSTENVPLSPESETRYGLKAAEIRNRGCVLTAPLYRLLLERQAVQIFMKMLSSCLFFVKFLYVSARWHSNPCQRAARGLWEASPLCEWNKAVVCHTGLKKISLKTLFPPPLYSCGRLTKWSKPCHWKPTSALS